MPHKMKTQQNQITHPVLSNMSNEERPRQMASKHIPHDKINIYLAKAESYHKKTCHRPNR